MARKPKTNTQINGRDYYKTSLTIGHNAKGNPIRKQFYGSTKTEAENKKKEYAQALDKGLNPDLGYQSLDMAIYTWLWEIERYSGNKSSSFERYEGIYRNYVKDTPLGLMRVSEIKKLAIQKYYNQLREGGKTYSQLKNLHKLLNKFFAYAESDGYISKNPCKGIKISKDDEENIEDDEKVVETFTQEETKQLINSLGDEKIKYIIMFALLTGARAGEILSLEKSDIEDMKVKINKTVRTGRTYEANEKYHYETRVTKPKTKNSKRIVPLPEIFKPELERLNKLVLREKIKLGPAYNENNLLFPSTNGTYIDNQNLRKLWIKALKKGELEYKKFHALRHTYATRLFENGASIMTVSRLLGHSTIKTTEIYTHVLEDVKEKEVECLNNMFL